MRQSMLKSEEKRRCLQTDLESNLEKSFNQSLTLWINCNILFRCSSCWENHFWYSHTIRPNMHDVAKEEDLKSNSAENPKVTTK
jgi:hypothetical protein